MILALLFSECPGTKIFIPCSHIAPATKLSDVTTLNTLSPCHRHREYSRRHHEIFLEQSGTNSERGGALCEDNAKATDRLQVTRSGL